MKSPGYNRWRDWRRARFNIFLWFYHILAVGVMGLSFFPAVALLYFSWQAFSGFDRWLKILCWSFLLAPAYWLFGITLVLASIILKGLLRLNVRPGLYRLASDWQVIQWMGCNLFIVIVNACFLDAFRISPFQNFFYRAMGARIGNGTRVNTNGLADLPLIEIGDDTIIGGGVTMICHLADRGYLRLSRVIIGNDVTIGLDTIIMPGTEIGDGAVIAPRSLLPPGTKIPPKGRFGGDPLRNLREDSRSVAGGEVG